MMRNPLIVSICSTKITGTLLMVISFLPIIVLTIMIFKDHPSLSSTLYIMFCIISWYICQNYFWSNTNIFQLGDWRRKLVDLDWGRQGKWMTLTEDVKVSGWPWLWTSRKLVDLAWGHKGKWLTLTVDVKVSGWPWMRTSRKLVDLDWGHQGKWLTLLDERWVPVDW